MREKNVVKGLVLRSTDTKEADQVLTVLTAPLGKVSVVAKGARSRRSRISAAAQLLCYSEMVLTESHGWQILSEASTIELFDPLRRDVVLLSLGSYFAELTDAVTPAGLEAGETLSLLLNALYALGHLQKDPALVKAAFEWRLMALSGFEPLIDGCAYCGNPQPEEPMLNVVQGVVRCRTCGERQGLSMPLTPGGLQAMEHILHGDPKRLYAFRLGAEDLRLLGDAAEAYVVAQLERGFRTLDFYKSLAASLPKEGENENKL